MSDAGAYLERLARTIPAAASGLLRPRQPTGSELLDVGFAEPPEATAGVRVHALVQNEWDAPTAVVIEGQLTPPTTRMSIGAFLVEHPSGIFLADAGMCADAHTRHLGQLPALLRGLTVGPPPRMGIAASIRAAGFDPAALRFALLTHVHWDHVSGLAELPGLPARADERDVRFAGDRATLHPGMARAALEGVALEGIALDGPPVLTFPASHDVFGDGSVVLCDLSGHTPGHCGILLALRSGARVLLAGDAVWNTAQVRLVRQRSAPARIADADPDAAYLTVLRLSRLPAAMTVIPAHDSDAIAAAFADGVLE